MNIQNIVSHSAFTYTAELSTHCGSALCIAVEVAGEHSPGKPQTV